MLRLSVLIFNPLKSVSTLRQRNYPAVCQHYCGLCVQVQLMLVHKGTLQHPADDREFPSVIPFSSLLLEFTCGVFFGSRINIRPNDSRHKSQPFFSTLRSHHIITLNCWPFITKWLFLPIPCNLSRTCSIFLTLRLYGLQQQTSWS